MLQLQPDSSPDTGFSWTRCCRLFLSPYDLTPNVQAGAQQVQREVLPEPGAGGRGGPADTSSSRRFSCTGRLTLLQVRVPRTSRRWASWKLEVKGIDGNSLRALGPTTLDNHDVRVSAQEPSSAMPVFWECSGCGRQHHRCPVMGVTLNQLAGQRHDWDQLLCTDAGGASSCQAWLPAQACSRVACHATGLPQQSPAIISSCEGFRGSHGDSMRRCLQCHGAVACRAWLAVLCVYVGATGWAFNKKLRPRMGCTDM